jgi:hypothetical protein
MRNKEIHQRRIMMEIHQRRIMMEIHQRRIMIMEENLSGVV